MKKNFLLILCLFIVIAFVGYLKLSKLSSKKNAAAQDTFIVGTSADFPPFSFLKDGEIQGFDIDIANEVAKRIGKNIKIKNLDFEMLIPELQLGHIHIISAGLTPTPARAERVLFTKPYVTDGVLTVVTLKSKPKVTSIDDLKGKEVIVNDGFTSDLYMSKNKDVKIKKFPTMAEAFLALNSNRGDAFVATKNTLKPFVKQHGDNYNFFEIEGTEQTSALAVSKEHPEILSEIQNVLDKMIEEGTIESLKKKWEL